MRASGKSKEDWCMVWIQRLKMQDWLMIRSKMQDWLKIPRNNNDDENERETMMESIERETVMESIERSQGESVGLRSLGC
jgi:hypothetical protein